MYRFPILLLKTQSSPPISHPRTCGQRFQGASKLFEISMPSRGRQQSKPTYEFNSLLLTCLVSAVVGLCRCAGGSVVRAPVRLYQRKCDLNQPHQPASSYHRASLVTGTYNLTDREYKGTDSSKIGARASTAFLDSSPPSLPRQIIIGSGVASDYRGQRVRTRDGGGGTMDAESDVVSLRLYTFFLASRT